ncbi:hypothetical protein V6N13_121954 [Hibiscus sabdariffa]|uniref:Uncharacterized protein n=2 Tax=Hibiscus sabdariffa TaxID=183260 RepID=A0ABR2C6F3_9ROSI
MESLSRLSFLLFTTIVFSSSTVVGAREVGDPEVSTGSKKWCVPKNGISDAYLQKSLDWACGQKDVDCAPIQNGAICFEPNNVRSRAAYAMNYYYRKHETEPGSCDFRGTAETTTNDPSKLKTFC